MTAPSKNWSNIADAQIDADSPLDTTLLTAIRDDLVHIKEWLGKDYTAAQNHNHDGVNSSIASSFTSLNEIEVYDHFLFLSGWTQSGTIAIQSAVNGVLRITTAGGAYQGIFQDGRAFQLSGSITVQFEARVKRVSGATPYTGLTDANSPGNGFYFEFTSGTNFIAVTQNSTTKTLTDTGVAATAGQWYAVKIVATSSAVLFYVDGVLKATHTTNIPTTNIGPAALIYNASAGFSLDVDYIRCHASGLV